MFRHMTCAVVLIVSVGSTLGAHQLWTVSQDNYASKVASLVTAKYEALLAEVEAFKPSLSACAQSVNDTVNKCVACLDTVDCAPSTDWRDKLEQYRLQMRAGLIYAYENSLAKVADAIADKAEELYNKYGAVAVSNLKTGFEAIGGAFSQLGDWIESGLQAAFDKIKDAFTALYNKFADVFGKRRKRSTMYAEAVAVRTKRDITISHEMAECMDKCPDCSPFSSGSTETAARAICGDTVVDKNVTMTAKLNQLMTYYGDWQNATQPLLREVYIDTATYKIAKMEALKGGSYVGYDLVSLGVSIAFNMFNQDATYIEMAEYVYGKYS